jgi:hypothetical protein
VKVIFALALLIAADASTIASDSKPSVSLDSLSRASKTLPATTQTSPSGTKPGPSKSDSVLDLRKKAEAGDAKSQLAFADQLLALQKYTTAEHWYRAAALQGEPAAIFGLGELYESNHGSGTNLVKGNATNSVALYQLSAALGYSKAHLKAAQAYKNGADVRKDFVRAYSHFKLSEAAGREQYMNQLIPEMSQEQIDTAEKIVADFKPAKFEEAFGNLVFDAIQITGIFGAGDRRIAMLNGKQLSAGQRIELNVGGLLAQVKLDEIANDGVFVTYGSLERKIKPQRL